MKRILFVDDEPLLLDAMRQRFAEKEGQWEMHFMLSGADAFRRMQEVAFDVVVADMRMPEMDGIELLNLVMERYPATIRIMLSGQTDRKTILRLVGTAHRYIAKPCELAEILRTVEQSLSHQNLLRRDLLRNLISQLQSLPSLPSLYLELVEALRRDDVSIPRIAQIIAKDMGMYSKLLQLVNSAFFGLPRRVADPEEAVLHLGIETVRTLVLYLHIIALFDRAKVGGFSYNRLWNHSWATGVLAKRMARVQCLGTEPANQAFAAGLLHDVGKLVLVTGLPSLYESALNHQRQQHIPLWEAEKSVFGSHHAEIGAYLLSLWGLPVPIVDAVAFHHEPASAPEQDFNLLTVVHAANALVHELQPIPGQEEFKHIQNEYLTKLGLTDWLAAWRETLSSPGSVPGAAP